MLKLVMALMIVFAAPIGAHAEDNELSKIKNYIPRATVVGKGRLNYLVWQIYDATLYAPDGRYQEGKPTALSLHYLRAIKGLEIADKSAEEIRRQGFDDEVTLAAWHEQMCRIFTDVSAGTVLMGIRTDKGQTIILKDGKKIGIFSDPEFSRHFFDIWLGDNTHVPLMRDALLNKKGKP